MSLALAGFIGVVDKRLELQTMPILAHPKNRPHRVDANTAQFLYTLYKLLFDASVDLRIKQRTFETAADSKNSWRVVSISQYALEHIAKTGDAKGLQRGHLLARIDRAKHLFECSEPLSQEQLLDYFFEHDTVALITKAENAKDGCNHWSKIREVPDGMFTAGSFSIYVRQRKEIPWVHSQVTGATD